MNINTDQLIQRIEHGIALLKQEDLSDEQRRKTLVTISALTREHAKQLGEKELDYETQ
jgi:hypothetical protein